MSTTTALIIIILIFSAVVFCVVGPITAIIHRRVGKRWGGLVIAVGILVGISGCLILGYAVYRSASQTAARFRPFELHLKEYVGIISNQDVHENTSRHASGRTIVIDIDGSEEPNIDGISFELPDNIRATTPEEVGTVASLACGKTKVGTYGGLGDAYRFYCNLRVFDKASGELIQQRTCEGSPPPGESLNGRDQEGGSPNGEVLNAIASLYKR